MNSDRQPGMQTPEKLAGIYFLLAVLTFLVGLPGLVLINSPGEFPALDIWSYIRQSAVLLVLGIAAFGGCTWLARRLGVTNAYIIVVVFASVYICIAGLLLPVNLTNVGVASTEVNWSNMLFATSLALLVTYFRENRLFLLSFIIFTGLAFVGGVVTIFGKEDVHEVDESFFELSRNMNVFYIDLDGLQIHHVRKVFDENESLREAFSDFVFFGNVNAVAPTTLISNRASILGRAPQRDGWTGDGWLEETREDTIIGKLQSSGFFVNSFEFQTNLKFDNLVSAGQMDDQLQPLQFLRLYSLGIWRIAPAPIATNIIRWIGRTSIDLEEFESPDGNLLWIRSLGHGDSYWWDRAYMLTIIDFGQFVNSITVGDRPRVAHFHHYNFTHFPLDFDKDCNYFGDRQEIRESSQNEAAAIEETECGLKQLSGLLGKLRQLEVYDNSFIILASDHGRLGRYNTDEKMARGNKGSMWSVSRYFPFLMIKDLNRSAESMEFIESPVSLRFIARTLCLRITTENCQDFAGLDLLSGSLPDDPGTETIFIPARKDSTHRLEDQIMIRVDRKNSLRDEIFSQLQ